MVTLLEKQKEAMGPGLLQDPHCQCQVCDPCPSTCTCVSSHEHLRMRKKDEYGCCVVKVERKNGTWGFNRSGLDVFWVSFRHPFLTDLISIQGMMKKMVSVKYLGHPEEAKEL